MARRLRYNPPPNWPQPPRGWKPDIGWQPDPAWGPAPPGWKLWDDRSWRRRHPVWAVVDGLGAAAVVIVVIGVVAAVGSSSKKPQNQAAASASPSTIDRSAGTSSVTSPSDYATQYQQIVNAYNVALASWKAGIDALGANGTAAETSAVGQPFANVLRVESNALTDAEWPAAIQPDARAMALDMSTLAVEVVTVGAPGWQTALGNTIGRLNADAEAVRVDLSR